MEAANEKGANIMGESRDDNLRPRPTKCLFFLDVGRDAWRQPENSVQSHMVSYCSAIKALIFGICKKHINIFPDEISALSVT